VVWWRRLSIAAKLPLGVGTLLLVVLGGMTVVVYVAERRGAIELATERLNRAGLQFAVGLGGLTDQRVRGLTELSRTPLVRQFLASGSAALADEVADSLRAHARTAGADAIELWSPAGRRLLTTDVEALAPRRLPESALADGTIPRPGVSGFERRGDRLLYTVALPVRVGSDGRAMIVERHALDNSPEEAAAVSQVVGSDARMLVGSPGAGRWTDLAGPVPGPPIEVSASPSPIEYERSQGEPVLARVLEVPGTPWLLVMEFGRASVVAPAQRFLRRSVLLALVLAVGGAGAAWLLSRGISGGLQQVTRAAEALAAGRDVAPIAVARADEVGRLGASFNAMARQVADSRHALELRVADRTAALEAANRELEAFSYSVSHDLRAPLRAVDGFAAVLVEDHAEELSSDARRCVGLIRNSAQQMGQLIDDLLTFSRLGRQPLIHTRIDMDALVRGIVAESCAGRRRDPAECTVDPLPPAWGEPSMVKQVVTNYIENALKFTAAARPAEIRVTGRVADGAAVYTVRDNGVGFDMRYVDKLFGVFQRLHAAEEYPGTGVGLAIVKRVVERHGGRVWAEGAPGRGAAFHFTLPGSNHSEHTDPSTMA
jgi:signal transduction histidine kinase